MSTKKPKTNNMKNLITKLTEETKELKTSFIAKTETYAKEEFKRFSKMFKMNQLDLGETLGFETTTYTEYGTTFKRFNKINGVAFWNHKESSKLINLEKKITSIENLGLEKFVSREVNKAKEHYSTSIEKLAYRIEKKNLDLNKIELTTSYLDPNISTIITDGEKTVRAFTIIAEGVVQKPHYRYLIK